MSLPFSAARVLACALVLLALSPLGARAQEEPLPPPQPVDHLIAEASEQAADAMSAFKPAPGLSVSLFAAEPMVANIVAISVDERGRVFVAEAFRRRQGVPDIRGLMSWLDDDLAVRTVQDRIEMHRRREGARAAERTRFADRIRLVEDADGDAIADKATVFHFGSNALEAGLAAGVLARGGEVYYTNIPSLHRLRDTDGDGEADQQSVLSTGYGVRMSFQGHDLHGLTFGPDGKLYFSMGDRGLNVETPAGRIENVDSGAVMRCDADGSNLELFATGLRNPQELAFDQFGNLFTGDNNADHGDPARWCYVVEGGDYGWHVGYQHLPRAGPWNAEKLHALEKDSTAAYLVPPLAHIGNGPVGVTYYPGTGLGAEYDDHFLMVDFKGTTSLSGIHSLAHRPRGASFEVVDIKPFIWNVLATDVEFGPDGAAYVSDWVSGWDLPMKGRIYRVFDEERSRSPIVAETRRLIAEGMDDRPLDELLRHLAHPDRRVRQAAQFALAAKGEEAVALLGEVARGSEHRLARVHAIWALGQVARKSPAAVAPAAALLKDMDDEVRAQAAKVVGEAGYAAAAAEVLQLLEDQNPRVRFHAAIAAGKLRRGEAVRPLLAMLRANHDRDAFLRHAGVRALAKRASSGACDPKSLTAFARDESAAVRTAVLLTYRRLGRAEVAAFLKDSDDRVVLEAARAINDVPIPAAFPALAELGPGQFSEERSAAIWRRVANASFRLGTPEGARRLFTIAADGHIPEAARVAALDMLADWATPSGRDKVVGLWRPLAARDAAPVRDAAGPVLQALARGPAPTAVRLAALKVAEAFELVDDLPSIVRDAESPAEVRAAALRAMAARKHAELPAAVRIGLIDKAGPLRREAIRATAAFPDAARQLDALLSEGSPADQQAVFSALGAVGGDAAEATLIRWLDRLADGKVSPLVRLDLLEAAAGARSAKVKAALARYEAARDAGDPLAPFAETLEGGDAEAGRKVFFDKSEVSCVRCHKFGGEELVVGPDLKGIGSRQDRGYILESIVLPNAKIAPGFENVRIKTVANKTYNGMIKAQTDAEVTMLYEDKEGKAQEVRIAKADIRSTEAQPSSMPDGLAAALTKRELRDLVEFLATQKE